MEIIIKVKLNSITLFTEINLVMIQKIIYSELISLITNFPHNNIGYYPWNSGYKIVNIMN